MKKIQILIALWLFCLPADAQWQQIQGLYGEPVLSLNKSASRVFINTGYGVLTSIDDGQNWDIVDDLYLSGITGNISSYFDTVIVQSSPQSYFSADSGNTWGNIPNPVAGIIPEIVHDEGITYAITVNDGYFLSTNLGGTWQNIMVGLPLSTNYNSISNTGQYTFLGTADGLFISDDNGFTFTPAPGSLGSDPCLKVYSSGSTVMAYSGGAVHMSDDSGLTWNSFDTGAPVADVTDFIIMGQDAYLCAGSEVYKSPLSSANWSAVMTGITAEVVSDIEPAGTDLLLGTSEGVFRSSNSGSSWTKSSNGIIPVQTESILFNSGRLLCGNSTYGLSRYEWMNGPWSYNDFNTQFMFTLMNDGDTIYAGTSEGIAKSSDNGISFTPLNISNPALISDAFQIAKEDSVMIAATFSSDILISTDYGTTWTSKGASGGLSGQLTTTVAISGGNLVTGTAADGIFLSTDLGDTWTQVTVAGLSIYDMTKIGSRIIASTLSANGCLYSDDDGQTWTVTLSDEFIKICTAGNLVLGTDGFDVYASIDSGATFAYGIQGPQDVEIMSLHASQTDVYIGTYYNGVWWAQLLSITGEDEPEGSDNSMQVSVFPNPASGVINYNLEIDEHTGPVSSLSIYDLTGRLIRTLAIASDPNTAGPYRGSEDISTLNAGAYIMVAGYDNGQRSRPAIFMVKN